MSHPWWTLMPRLGLATSLAGALLCIWRLASQVFSTSQARPRPTGKLALVFALLCGIARAPCMWPSSRCASSLCMVSAPLVTDTRGSCSVIGRCIALVTCMGAVRFPGALAYHRAVYTPRCARLLYAVCISTDARAAMLQLVVVAALTLMKTAHTARR